MPADPSSAFGKYLSLALLVPVGTFVGFLMGYGLDVLFHTTWIRYVFLALGSAGGLIELVRAFNKDT